MTCCSCASGVSMLMPVTQVYKGPAAACCLCTEMQPGQCLPLTLDVSASVFFSSTWLPAQPCDIHSIVHNFRLKLPTSHVSTGEKKWFKLYLFIGRMLVSFCSQ